MSNIDTVLKQTISPEQAWHFEIVPRAVFNDTCQFYSSEETSNHNLQEELEIIFGKRIELIKMPKSEIHKAILRIYGSRNVQGKGQNIDLEQQRSDDFLFRLIDEAMSAKSSDIHLEAYEEQCRVRIRIDGKLIERYIIDRSEYPALINKIKIRANLDIAEKRLPQDGRIFYSQEDEKFDIRVSVLPTLHGEKVVLRLLSRDAADIDIQKLGFSNKQLEQYLSAVRKPHGIILISGPTGSGKTTTLYATLKILNSKDTNILTIEDPIEYTLEGINQVQLKENIGLTFASALRTFLRQDPDIIMLGEIRDGATAEMAIRSALTGHLVLSTIHTNSAWGTISRLVDMGVPSYLLASTLNASIAQRLVRLLCPNCKQPLEADEVKIESLKNMNHGYSFFKPVGCEKCFYTGYQGRTAIYELISVDPAIKQHIKENTLDVSEIFTKDQFISLKRSAIKLFTSGRTSQEEIYPILSTM